MCQTCSIQPNYLVRRLMIGRHEVATILENVKHLSKNEKSYSISSHLTSHSCELGCFTYKNEPLNVSEILALPNEDFSFFINSLNRF